MNSDHSVFSEFLDGNPVVTRRLLLAWYRREAAWGNLDIGMISRLCRQFFDEGELRAVLDVAHWCFQKEIAKPLSGFFCEGFQQIDPRSLKEYFLFLQTISLAAIRLGQPDLAVAYQPDIHQEWERLQGTLDEADRRHLEPEVGGVQARVFKDRYLLSLDQGSDPDYLSLERAIQIYTQYAGQEKDASFCWMGINVAACRFWMGDYSECLHWASSVEKACTRSASNDYWTAVTLAESRLLQWAARLDQVANDQNTQAALNSILLDFQTAAKLAETQWSKLQTSRRQLKYLLQHITKMPRTGFHAAQIDAWIQQALPMPPVLVFCGHMVDAPGRAKPRFPVGLVDEVRTQIRKAILEKCPNGPWHGFASCANGSDILFHEVLQELGGQSHIILPYQSEEFIQDSVILDGKPDWLHRLEGVRSHATEEILTSPHRLSWQSIAYVYTNHVMLGLSLLKAHEFGSAVQGIAVWDGRLGDGVGGTADCVHLWRSAQIEPQIIDMEQIRRTFSTGTLDLAAGAPESHLVARNMAMSVEYSELYEAGIKALLFADIHGFSGLTDQQLTRFMSTIWTAIANHLDSLPHTDRPIASNTWGDALYLVFDTVSSAGKVALDLIDIIDKYHRESAGEFPVDLKLRVALHAGPAYKMDDRIMGRVNYFGSHVTHAARLEPVTEPGQVYATAAFAALAALDGVLEFQCHYVGRILLAKRYGDCETYQVRRAGSLLP